MDRKNLSPRWNEFLDDLKKISTLTNVEYTTWGVYGNSLSYQWGCTGNLDELMKKYPEATKTSLRRGSMIVSKELAAELRDSGTLPVDNREVSCWDYFWWWLKKVVFGIDEKVKCCGGETGSTRQFERLKP